MNIINKLFLTLTGFLGLSALLLLQSNKNEARSIQQTGSIEQACVAQVDAAHKKVLEDVRKEFSIPVVEWQKAMDKFHRICNRNKDIFSTNPAVPATQDPLEERIYTLLAKAGLNPAKIKIVYFKDELCPIMAVQEFNEQNQLVSALHVNKQWFATHAVELQNAIISHEIIHLKNFDSIESGCIREVLLAHGASEDQYFTSESMQNFRHHRELRADLLAAANDIEIAKGLQKDFCNCVEKNLQLDTLSHPPIQVRMDQMAHLIKDLEKQTIQIA